MLPDVQHLNELQNIDREILRLKDEIAAFPRRISAIEQRLAGTRSHLESTRNAVKADEAARRKFETAIQDLQQKISKYRDQSLAVKTNEQYKALMQEIQFSEIEIRANEDNILNLMVNAEAREKDVKAAEATLKAETAEIEKEKAEAAKRTAEDEKQLTEWNAKREAARAGVNPDMLRHYDRVLKFRGTGLAEVRDQKCMGCQVVLRPQTFNEVRGGQVVVCESCQRILYFDPSTEVAVERPTASVKRRSKSNASIDRAWYYRPDFPGVDEAFIAFVNHKSSCSRRVYDAHTGRLLGAPEKHKNSVFTLSFSDDIDSAVRLNSGLDEQQLDDWGNELPSVILSELHEDLKLVRDQIPAGNTDAAPQPT